jgi:hypothetical protein
MAALQNRNGSYRVLFEYQRKQRAFTIGRVSESEARAKAAQVEYLLLRLNQRLIELPPGIGIVEYVRHDGKPPVGTEAIPERRTGDPPLDLLAGHEGRLLVDLRITQAVVREPARDEGHLGAPVTIKDFYSTGRSTRVVSIPSIRSSLALSSTSIDGLVPLSA